MKVESVEVKRFRSIQSCELSNCGGFNVIIGKNNSGKSNILSAIDTFFSCLHGENIVTLDPPIGKTIDFFGKAIELPLEITISFSLQEDEREALYHDIVTDAPQRRYAVEGIDPSSNLYITVSIININRPRAFVSKILLKSNNLYSIKSDERIILNVGREAALELCEQYTNLRQINKDMEGLHRIIRRIDSEDWRRYLADVKGSDREPISIRSILRRILSPTLSGSEFSVGLPKRLEAIMVGTTYEDFSMAVQTVQNTLQEEAASVQERELRNKIDTFAGEESSIPNYVRNLLQNVSQIKILYLKEQRKQIGNPEAQRLLSLKMERGGPKVLSSIQEIIRALLGVQVDAFLGTHQAIATTSTFRAESNAELDVDDFLVEVNGSGIREALRLVLDYEFMRPDILLVEEPEIHLHPSLETSMMRYLQQISSICQVFVTTHSTNFIDTAEMKNVYLISKSHSTQVQKLNFDEAEIQLPRELGLRLSSLFMFDRLVFTEGPTDEGILREWATKLKVNFSRANVGFIIMEGSRNFAHYAKSDILAFLTKRRVKMWFLLDRDEREDQDVIRLEKTLGRNASLKVLRRREIENYLLYPRAIIEFIKLKRKLSEPTQSNHLPIPIEDEIMKSLDDMAELLKQFTIDKRVARKLCKSMHPSLALNFGETHENSIIRRIIDENDKMIQRLEEINAHADEVYEFESKRINETWQSIKLDIVPGDHLLDMVCQKYGVRYKKKEQDGARLASLMNEQEIDIEIKNIIQDIGAI